MSKIKCLNCGEVLSVNGSDVHEVCSCNNKTYLSEKEGRTIVGGKDVCKISVFREKSNKFEAVCA